MLLFYKKNSNCLLSSRICISCKEMPRIASQMAPSSNPILPEVLQVTHTVKDVVQTRQLAASPS